MFGMTGDQVMELPITWYKIYVSECFNIPLLFGSYPDKYQMHFDPEAANDYEFEQARELGLINRIKQENTEDAR